MHTAPPRPLPMRPPPAAPMQSQVEFGQEVAVVGEADALGEPLGLGLNSATAWRLPSGLPACLRHRRGCARQSVRVNHKPCYAGAQHCPCQSMGSACMHLPPLRLPPLPPAPLARRRPSGCMSTCPTTPSPRRRQVGCHRGGAHELDRWGHLDRDRGGAHRVSALQRSNRPWLPQPTWGAPLKIHLDHRTLRDCTARVYSRVLKIVSPPP
jgi:hypothetical protein